jgi:hypothetical protein
MPYNEDYDLAGIKEDIDARWNAQQEQERADRERNGISNVGTGSWTSGINKYNAARRDEYMQASKMANQERRLDEQASLAKRQQAFGEASNVANLRRASREHQDALALQNKRDEEAKRQFQMSFGLQNKQYDLNRQIQQAQMREAKEARTSGQNIRREEFGKTFGRQERRDIEDERRWNAVHGLEQSREKESARRFDLGESRATRQEEEDIRRYGIGESRASRMEQEGNRRYEQERAYREKRDVVSDRHAGQKRLLEARRMMLDHQYHMGQLSLSQYKQKQKDIENQQNSLVRAFNIAKQEQTPSAAAAPKSDALLGQVQGLMGQIGGTANAMAGVGTAQQNLGSNLLQQLSSDQRDTLNRAVKQFWNETEFQARQKQIGYENARREQELSAMMKAQASGLLPQAITDVVGLLFNALFRGNKGGGNEGGGSQ